ncbi:MAG TPA: type VI secretion system accessory protein TagJ [Chthoniobacterales bacterium]
MTPQEFVRTGDLGGALASAQTAVRKNPSDSQARIFLFQLQCVLGNWEKALTQLQVLSEMDADCMLLAQIFRPILGCEMLRADVFAGKRTPIIFGEPEEWMGKLVHANRLSATGEFEAAAELRTEALDAAEVSSGDIDGQPFEWIADSDSRLGPVLEVIMDGVYRWVPFSRTSSIHLEVPQDLRDLVWIAAQFTWTNGGEGSGVIPARYPGSETATDSALQLARKTEWKELPGHLFSGLGQRMLTTDQNEFGLLDIRKIQFNRTTKAGNIPEHV